METGAAAGKTAIILQPAHVPSEVAGCGVVYWLLCAHGLEPEAEALITRGLAHVHFRLCRLSPPKLPRAHGDGAGEAAVGQLLLGLDAPLPPEEVLALPGIIHACVLVAAADNIPDRGEEALPAIETWAAGLGAVLVNALPFTSFAACLGGDSGGGVGAPRFRASVVRDGDHDFKSLSAMIPLGAGAGNATAWKADLSNFEVEVFALIFFGSIRLGLGVSPTLYAHGGTKLPREKRPWLVAGTDRKRLRPSTATLLLELAQLAQGESLLDCCGGVGTIALEAATRIPGVRALSVDSDKKATECARQNVAMAQSGGLLASASLVEVKWGCLEDEIKAMPDGGSFEAVVTEMPFGCAYRKMVPPDVLLNCLARALRPTVGRAVVVAPPLLDFRQGVADFPVGPDGEAVWSGTPELREGNVGGIDVQIVVLRRGAAVTAPVSVA